MEIGPRCLAFLPTLGSISHFIYVQVITPLPPLDMRGACPWKADSDASQRTTPVAPMFDEVNAQVAAFRACLASSFRATGIVLRRSLKLLSMAPRGSCGPV